MQALRTAKETYLVLFRLIYLVSLLKRDSNTGLLLWILLIIQKHVFCVEDLWMAGSETPVSLFKKPFFKDHLQWLLLTVSGYQPAPLLKEGLQKRRFSVIFAKFLRISFCRTSFSGWLLLVFTCNFEKFFRSLIL